MRRTLILCIVLSIVCLSSGFAQVPNGGFESWALGNPDGWATTNALGYVPISASATAHNGSYAVRGEVVPFFTTVLAPALQSGPGASGFAYAGRPASVTGYYQFYPVGGDRFGVNVGLTVGGLSGTQVGIAAQAISTGASSWTQFDVPFVYQTGDMPDVCIMQFQIVGPGTGANSAPHTGSYFLLDDLELPGSTGIARESVGNPLRFSLEQNYPNPFNPSTTIGFTLPDRSFTRLVIYNSLGEEVMTLLDREMEAGRHSVVFASDGLPAGVYYYRLVSGSNVNAGKMCLLK